MARRTPLLPRVVRRLPSHGLAFRVLDRLERWLVRRRLPLEGFEAAGAELVRLKGDLVVSMPREAPTADDAQRANLDLVVGLCAQLDVEHFVVGRSRRAWSRVGVPVEQRGTVIAALRDLGRVQPVYAGKRDLVVGQTAADLERAAVVEVWQSLHDPVTGRCLGNGQACRLEFWDELDDGRLVAPSANLRAAQVTPRERAAPVSTQMGDATYRTIPPFDEPGPFEVTFPVDLVYLWVDGGDPAWLERRNRRLASLGRAPVEQATASSRFREHDELRYSLRSVERFAPWARHVYLVTDQQRPHWLVDEHPWLTVVDHRDIFPDDALPIFNSHALTARVHHIPGLSEHFLLMNDDVLFGQPVGPEAFFHANGVSRFFLSRSPIPSGPIAPDELPHMAARKRVRDLIREAYGFTPFQTFKHTPVALHRSWLEHLERRFAADYEHTVRSPFRSSDDIVPSWLHHYSAFAEGRAVPSDILYDYFNLGQPQSFPRLAALLRRRSVDCFCLNDDEGKVEAERRTELLAAFMELFLPVPGQLEKPRTLEASRAELLARLESTSQR